MLINMTCKSADCNSAYTFLYQYAMLTYSGEAPNATEYAAYKRFFIYDLSLLLDLDKTYPKCYSFPDNESCRDKNATLGAFITYNVFR